MGNNAGVTIAIIAPFLPLMQKHVDVFTIVFINVYNCCHAVTRTIHNSSVSFFGQNHQPVYQLRSMCDRKRMYDFSATLSSMHMPCLRCQDNIDAFASQCSSHKYFVQDCKSTKSS